MKFSFSKAASTLSLAALGVAAATSAQAAISSINLEVAKVTLYPSSVNSQGDGVVVFDAANGVGGSSNVTVDLLNSTDAAGKSISLRNLTTDQAGVYRTAIVELVKLEALDDTTPTPNPTDLKGLLLGSGTDPVSGQTVIALGEVVTGDAGTNDLDDVYGITGSLAAMKPISTAGGVVTLPTLDIQIPAASVVDNAGTAELTQAPVFATIAPASAATTDDASITDVRIEVNVTNSDLDDVVVPGEDATLTVGLFPSDNILVDPIYVATATYTGTVTATATTATQTVDLIDVAYGTYLPIAWNDTNSNGKLDAGEKLSAHDLTNFTTGEITFDSTDALIASTDVTDAFTSGGASPAVIGNDVADAAVAMPAKNYNVVLHVADTAISVADDSLDFTLTTAITSVAEGATGTVTIDRNGADIALPVTWSIETNTDATATIDTTDIVAPVLTAEAISTIGSTAGLAYNTTDTELTITLPFTDTTSINGSGFVGAVTSAEIRAAIFDGAVKSSATQFDVDAEKVDNTTSVTLGNDVAGLIH